MQNTQNAGNSYLSPLKRIISYSYYFTDVNWIKNQGNDLGHSKNAINQKTISSQVPFRCEAAKFASQTARRDAVQRLNVCWLIGLLCKLTFVTVLQKEQLQSNWVCKADRWA